MKVRQLIQHLLTLDPDAEVMIDAPVACAKLPAAELSGQLTLPVLAVSYGRFRKGSGDLTGRAWVSIVGTDIWGLDTGVRDRPCEQPVVSRETGDET